MADLELTRSDSGRHVTLHAGGTLHLRLDENASSGYRWAIAALDRTVLEVVAETFTAHGGGAGSGGIAEWTLRAVKAGATRLELTQSRRWQGVTAQDERFVLDVTAAG